ncbi:phosphotransferase system sugar-specific EII component [Streptococcus pneumoniae]|nr:phosphotransferase system sugar-specific EII component [Streptococcus pneumoniae]
MIMGPQDNIYTVALLPEDGPEEFTAKFEAVIEGLDDFLVFADLLGGTPCNVVSRLIMEGRDIDLYAGMNLPMVIEFINASLTGADADYKSRAAESIVKVNDLLAGFDDDEDEYTLRKSLQTTSVLSETSKQCFEQPATFLVCSLIFIDYKMVLILFFKSGTTSASNQGFLAIQI